MLYHIANSRTLTVIVGVALTAVSATAIATSFSRTHAGSDPDGAATTVAPLTLTAAKLVAREVGFSSTALAASGCSAADAETLLSLVAAHPEDAGAIEDLQFDAARAAKALARAQDAAWRSGATPIRGLNVKTARSEAASTRSAMTARMKGLRSDMLTVLAGLVGVDDAAISARMVANAARPVPDAWKCLALSPSQWRTLEQAHAKSASGPIETRDLHVA